MPSSLDRFRLFGFWLLSVAAFWILYSNGLPGTFIFDDQPNLNGLKSITDGHFSELLSYSLQGHAGPGGRPVSLFSFALQHESWPGKPANFKQVNMLIHAINATLLWWLFERLYRLLGGRRSWPPLAAAALWLLLPIHVSAVLYVVQRMTLLSAGCMFLGMALYVEARIRHISIGPLPHLHALFLTSLLSGVVLGILCKENAIVFPLLILALEATLLSRLKPAPTLWKLTLWIPILIFVVYLSGFHKPWLRFGHRNFDLTERVLTEGRVLWMYIRQIVLPSAGSLHFLYDNYPVSTTLISPPITALSWISWLVVATWAWIKRKRFQLAAFAVLFFLASHMVESTVLPLELVFEHRNYVGSAAIAFMLAIGTAQLDRVRRLARIALGACYFAAIIWTTFNVTALWGNPLVQKRIWYEQNKESPRVHIAYASAIALEGYPHEAARLLEEASVRFPEHINFPLARIELGCYYPELKPNSLEAARSAARSGTENMLSALMFLDRLTSASIEDSCLSYQADEILELVQAAQTNPAFRRRQADVIILEGVLHSAKGDTLLAREQLRRALAIDKRPRFLVQAAAWELGNRNLLEARVHLDALSALQSAKPIDYLAVRDDVRMLEDLYQQLLDASIEKTLPVK